MTKKGKKFLSKYRMTYTIKNDWLVEAKKVPAPAKSKTNSGINTREFIVMHYTAGPSAVSAHNNYANPAVAASWHLTIDRDGTIYQLAPFSAITWHAGKSEWKHGAKNYPALNPVSIGIEIVNAGPLEIKNGKYVAWYGKEIPKEDVFIDKAGKPWQNYTDAQMKVIAELVPYLARYFKVKDVLGHSQISPGRKVDPGPAFGVMLAKLRKFVLDNLT